MSVDEIVNQLASVGIHGDQSPRARESSTSMTTNDGTGTVKQLRSYLASVRVGASPNELRKAAKQHCRRLFKIAQTGLRNRSGGSEPLHLACEAMHALLPLYSFAEVANLVMEKLWYQAVARCVDIGEFSLGLRATASLQACLNKRHGYAANGATICSKGVECCPAFKNTVDDGLRLYPFPPPAKDSQLDVVTLVSGAGLNACRCCLEVGSKEALLLVTGKLGCSAGMWIDRVCVLGEPAKAETYRDHLFKLLWRACSTLEQSNVGATAHQCMVGRQTALNVLLTKKGSWSVDSFVAHAHRGAVALECSAGDYTRTDEAARLSSFCLKALDYKEGGNWPDTDQAGDTGMHSLWVDWLQHSASLQEKIGDKAEAQRLLQNAYQYVRRCWRRRGVGPDQAQDYRAASCAAYASILKVHAASTITAQHPPPQKDRCSSTIAVSPSAGKGCTNKRTAKTVGVSLGPNSSHAFARGNICKALEYIGDVCEALGAVARAAKNRDEDVGEETSAFVGAALKAWKWAQRACNVIALWSEQEQTKGGKEQGRGGTEMIEWSELNARTHNAVGDLSRILAVCSLCTPELFERTPQSSSISELAIDFYLRAANMYLVAWAQVNHPGVGPGLQTVRRHSEDTAAGESARQALLAAEGMEGVEGSTFTSQQMRRAGVGWYALGTSLIDRFKIDTGLTALVRGCRLLERWTETAASHSGVDGNGKIMDVQILRSAQLDLRLSKLSRVLQDSGEFSVAASAAARALAFCPDLQCISPTGQMESPAGALTLIERYTTCCLQCRRLESLECQGGVQERESLAGKMVTAVTVRRLVAYLSDGDDYAPDTNARGGVMQNVSIFLKRKGCPPPAVVWALLAECQAYRTHLKLYASSESGCSAGENQKAVVNCIEQHRQSTDAVLEICTNREGKQDGGENLLTRVGMWEALARIMAARLEHDIVLASVEATSDAQNADGVGTPAIKGDLAGGLLHTSSGAEAASNIGENDSFFSTTAAALAGVCWCIRALILRDMGDKNGDTRRAMRRGLELVVQAVRNPGWTPESSWQTVLGSGGAVPVKDLLEVMENHFILHGDTLWRINVGEIRAVIADRATLASEAGTLPGDAAASAAALTNIGTAYHIAGTPALASVYQAAAEEKLLKIQDGRETTARIAVGVLRGLCLAGHSGCMSEAEESLLDIRRALSCPEPGLISPATVAFLDCAVGMGLSWMLEGRGRLAEAMDEIRHVLRLCHAWASADGPVSMLDRQVVVLSAVKGTSIHDEESCERKVAASKVQTEEGLGEEYGGVEVTISNARAVEEDGRDNKESALSSRWIPIYLEGLARMGRLWRARGFASKASNYLRQGCVASESLGATSLLRRCLLEEVEVASGMHRFSRADRLLRASKDLLQQERRELSETDSVTLLPCTTCVAIGNAGTCDQTTAQVVAIKGKGSRKGMRKGGGKVKLTPGSTSSSSPGLCVRCHGLALNAAEFTVAEACLLRKKQDFAAALAVCEQGQIILTPLVRAASAPPRVGSSLMLTGVSPKNVALQGGGKRGEEGQGLGWPTVRVLAALRLEQGRAEYLLGNVATAREIFRECARMDGAPALVIAASLYRIGRMQLDVGDTVGARPLLKRARALTIGAGAPKLTRNVRRVLAVASTKCGESESVENVGVDGSWDVAALVSLSIGVTHCNQVVYAAARQAHKDERMQHPVEKSAGLQLFDLVSRRCHNVEGLRMGGRNKLDGPEDDDAEVIARCLQEAITSDLRAEWPVVTMCLAPGKGDSKRLLLTRLSRGRPPLTVSVPLSPEDVQLLDRWRGAMEENHHTLRGHSADEAAGWGTKEKADWWKRRADVDETIDSLLRELEESWLAAHGLSAALVGEVVEVRLGLKLADVVDFAKGQISAARREILALGSKARGKGKAGKRSRGGVKAVGEPGPGAQGDFSSSISELIRLCVCGGNVMNEQAWCEVIRLCLSHTASEETVAKLSREIREAVAAVFIEAEVEERVDPSSSGISASMSTKRRLTSSLDIERDRSVGIGGHLQATAPITPVPPSTSSSNSPIAQSDLSTMKVADLRRELAARGIATTGLKLKVDLLARLSEAVQQEEEETLDCGSCGVEFGISAVDSSDEIGVSDRSDGEGGYGDNVIDRHPVVLVLDERLQALPWEGLPCLRGHAVTRVPAVPFVFSALEARWHKEADVATPKLSRGCTREAARGAETAWLPSRNGLRLNRGFYVIDPEGNLPHTRQQLGPVFEEIGRRLGWTGVQGKVPAEEDMLRALQEVDLFAYCGHGAGELLVGREAVARMTQCAVAILMGCSSGRLKGYGDFEPTGMASSYLAGGSPAVVANLWDVTDKDIDRFSTALLKSFLGGEDKARGQAPTLAHAVAAARSECKMHFIVGYAPVCYGIPVEISTS